MKPLNTTSSTTNLPEWLPLGLAILLSLGLLFGSGMLNRAVGDSLTRSDDAETPITPDVAPVQTGDGVITLQ